MSVEFGDFDQIICNVMDLDMRLLVLEDDYEQMLMDGGYLPASYQPIFKKRGDPAMSTTCVATKFKKGES
jgi:hypothetical protein